MRKLLTPKWLACHVLVWVTVAAFMALAWWQAGRALEGNTLSWAYTFEWPLFAVFLIYLWVREMRMAAGKDAPGEKVPAQARRGPVITRREQSEADDADPSLAEYNRYLAWLSRHPDARPTDYRESPC